MNAALETRIGRRLKNENTIVGTDLKALFRQVERVAKAVGVNGDAILLGRLPTHSPTAWWDGLPALVRVAAYSRARRGRRADAHPRHH